MKHEQEDRPVSDAPTYDDRWWFTVAIAAFIIAAVAFVFAAAWTFAESGQNAVYRAQTFSPFGIALGAVVTFCTVVWRGVLSTQQTRLNSEQIRLNSEQLKNQTEQLRQLVRQNDAREDESLVKLLQDGSKFVSETEKPAQIVAGITSLDALIANDKNGRYSTQGMDVLADFYARNYLHGGISAERARAALNRAARAGLTSTVEASFEASSITHYWRPVAGFKRQIYKGGHFQKEVFDHVRDEATYFDAVLLVGVEKIEKCIFKDCKFVRCSFSAWAAFQFEGCTFQECDFSGCLMVDYDVDKLIEQMTIPGTNNYFYEDNPPRPEHHEKWKAIFAIRDPHRRIIDA